MGYPSVTLIWAPLSIMAMKFASCCILDVKVNSGSVMWRDKSQSFIFLLYKFFWSILDFQLGQLWTIVSAFFLALYLGFLPSFFPSSFFVVTGYILGDPFYSDHIYKFIPPESLKSISAELEATPKSNGGLTPWLCPIHTIHVFPQNSGDQDLSLH